MEIAKRLNAIIAQLLPFLSQEVTTCPIYSLSPFCNHCYLGNSDQGLCASCWDYALRRLRQTFFARHSFHASKSVLIIRIGVDKVLKDQGPLSFSGAEEIWIKKRGRAGANLSGWPSMVGGRALFALIDTSWLEVALIQPQQCIAWPQTTFPTTNKPLQV